MVNRLKLDDQLTQLLHVGKINFLPKHANTIDRVIFKNLIYTESTILTAQVMSDNLPSYLQTIITAQTLSIGGEGVTVLTTSDAGKKPQQCKGMQVECSHTVSTHTLVWPSVFDQG